MTGAISFGCATWVFGWSAGREQMAKEFTTLMREDRVGWAEQNEAHRHIGRP
jgi:hypothetical protein